MTHTPESDISVISFYASHVITAGGSGGMLMVNSLEQKNVALQYRDWGRMGTNVEDMSERFGHSVDGIEYDFKFLYSVAGYNFKSSEMNAAFGLAQMKKLDGFLAVRRKNTERCAVAGARVRPRTVSRSARAKHTRAARPSAVVLSDLCASRAAWDGRHLIVGRVEELQVFGAAQGVVVCPPR